MAYLLGICKIPPGHPVLVSEMLTKPDESRADTKPRGVAPITRIDCCDALRLKGVAR